MYTKYTLIPILIAFFFLLMGKNAAAQILTNSDLPIIIIQTDEEIPDEPKILGTMGIIDNGAAPNNINDTPNHYDGFVGIETRGNSTQGFDKKTYTVELWDEEGKDISEPLLGMGKEEDWVLHAMVIDKTQLRIPMSFYLARRMGHYAAYYRFVELVVNDEYQGLYILTENVKRDDDRVDIAKLDDDDIAGDSLTGGYILRIDWLDDVDGFQSNFNSQGGIPMVFQWHYPKANNIQPEQADYIENWMHTFESALFDDDYTNNQGIRYSDYIDVNSFTDFLLMNELSKNADGYKLSSYLHKNRDDKDGRLKAGPIWDFDQTYGMSRVCSNDNPEGWTYLQNQDECEDLESMPLWWQRMMSDPVFVNHLKCRWETMREGAFHQDSLHNWIDVQVGFLGDALDRNFDRWDFIGEEIWIEPFPIPQTYDEEIVYMKNWINNRLDWIDANIPGDCSLDVVSTDDLETALSFQFVPNPASQSIFIDGVSEGQLIFYTATGQKVLETTLRNAQQQVDISDLPKGIYFATVIGKEVYQTQKLVVK